MPNEAALPVDPAPEYHKAEWRFERVAWVVMLTIGAAALLGLFGGGPVSPGRAQSADGALQVEYLRFGRGSNDAGLVVTIAGISSVDGHLPVSIPVSIPTPYLSHFDVGDTLPQPVRSHANQDATVWEFEGVDRQSSVIRFSLRLKGDSFGILRGVVEASGRRVEFTQYIWP